MIFGIFGKKWWKVGGIEDFSGFEKGFLESWGNCWGFV
jgi:hypothetical protein|tara:strand:- start:23 stop:136 length:114 start_codon:yes stop_codon:yes gene_type:complete